MSQRLRAGCHSHRGLAYVPVVVLVLAVLALVMAVQAPAAAAHSILVVAPHPDDDLLCASGVVANALAAGDGVKVVYMTNGDLTGVGTASGQGLAREDEAVAGQAVLGTPENDLIFLGYPDTGLQELFTDYRYYSDPTSAYTGVNGVSQTYGDRGLGGSDYHFSQFGSHANYNRPDVLTDLDSVISTYRPDDVYTTDDLDAHSDHSTTYDFVKLALLDVMASDPTYQPTLHSTIIDTGPTYRSVWPEATNPTTPMTEPPDDILPVSGAQSWSEWEHLPVPAAMRSTNLGTNPKYQAIAKHASQDRSFLYQFVHSDEIFWPETLSVPTNIAPLATATASTQNTVTGQLASSAVDGYTDGSPGGDESHEWATVAEGVGAWLTLTWQAPVWIDHIVLYDRPNSADQITGATLHFSDGSNVTTGALPNDGSAKTITFTPRSASSVTMTVTGVSGSTTNVGLAEMEVDRVLPPSGTFAIGNNATYTTTATPTLNNAVTDDTSMQMRFSNGNGLWSTWEPYSATKSWSLLAGDGSKTVTAQFEDAAGNVLSLSDTIILDATPPSGSFTVTGNAEAAAQYTDTTAVTLDNAISDANGVTEMRFANGSDASGAAWVPYSSTQSWTLPAGDGSKTVAAQFKDTAGNIYSTSSTITLDTTPPAGSFTIDDGAQYTNTTTATLANAVTDASGVSQMQFSNDGVTWSGWEPYDAGKTWTLSAGDGAKTVSARFEDSAGNVYATSSAITVDTTNPSGSVTITGNPAAAAHYTGTPAVTLHISVSAGGAMAQMRFANGGDAMGAWETYSDTKSWTLPGGDGLKTVTAQFKSAAGNVYATTSSITLDTTAPTVTSDAGTAWHKAAVTVHLSPADVNLGVPATQYRLKGAATWLDTTGNAFTVSGNGIRTYEYRALDKAGNASAVGTCTVRIDTTRPQARAPYAASVYRGRYVTLKFRVADSWPRTGKATVTLTIKTMSGRTVRTMVLKSRSVNTLLSYRFRCNLKRGTYRFYVSARDAAGNAVSKAAGNRLVVK